MDGVDAKGLPESLRRTSAGFIPIFPQPRFGG